MRTTEAGIMMRATAIVRANSIASIAGDAPLSNWSPSGVPAIGTSALIGTEPGCSGNVASATSNPMRSDRVSPRPIMPPQQTPMPAARTRASVASRSPNVRVLTTSP